MLWSRWRSRQPGCRALSAAPALHAAATVVTVREILYNLVEASSGLFRYPKTGPLADTPGNGTRLHPCFHPYLIQESPSLDSLYHIPRKTVLGARPGPSGLADVRRRVCQRRLRF